MSWKNTTQLFKKVINEGDVVVDLGANIGYFSLLAAQLVGARGKVYSFEPEPKNYHYLQRNIRFIILVLFIIIGRKFYYLHTIPVVVALSIVNGMVTE